MGLTGLRMYPDYSYDQQTWEDTTLRPGTDPFTFGAIVKLNTNSPSSAMNIFAGDISGYTAQQFRLMVFTDGKVRLTTRDSTVTQGTSFQDTLFLLTNTYYQIALVRNGVAYDFYVDGVLRQSVTSIVVYDHNEIIDVNQAYYRIGSRGPQLEAIPQNPLDGTMTNIFFVPSALSAADLSTVFQGFCYDCPVGYTVGSGTSCTECAIGTYKNSVGASTCTACPADTTTSGSGSITSTNCSCVPGYYGPDGGPCVTCPADTYKPDLGTVCEPCPQYSTNLGLSGSVSSSSCQCIAGYYGPNGGTCLPCPENYYKTSVGSGPCTFCGGTLNGSICLESLPAHGYNTPSNLSKCGLNETWEELILHAQEGAAEIFTLDTLPGFDDLFIAGQFEYVVCTQSHSCYYFSESSVGRQGNISNSTGGSQHVVNVNHSVCFIYDSSESGFLPFDFRSTLPIPPGPAYHAGCRGYNSVTATSGKVSITFPPSGQGIHSFCTLSIMPAWFYGDDNYAEDDHSSSEMPPQLDLAMDYGWEQLRTTVSGVPATSMRYSKVPSVRPAGKLEEGSRYPFLVSIQDHGAQGRSKHKCSGILIHPRWVVTTGMCVMPCVNNCTERVTVFPEVSKTDDREILDSGVSLILLHPIAFSEGVEALALMRLEQNFENVVVPELSSLLETDPETCFPGYSVVSYNQSVSWDATNSSDDFETKNTTKGDYKLVSTDVDLYDQEQCRALFSMDKLEDYLLSSERIVTPNTACVAFKHDRPTPEGCIGDLGAILMGHRNGEVVILGVESSGENCLRAGTPAVFSQFTLQVRQWILSHTGGLQPIKKLVLTLNTLRIPPLGSVVVYRGASQLPQRIVKVFRAGDTECEESVELQDDGSGAFLIAIYSGSGASFGQEQPKFEVEGSFRTSVEPSFRTFSGFDVAPGCSTALTKKQMVSLFSASRGVRIMQGGLTAIKSVYGSWICLRDWNSTEQVLCGLQHQEWGCFFHNTRTMKYDYQGTGRQLRYNLPI